MSEDFITQIRKENKLPRYLLAHLLESQSIEHNLAFITTWGLGSRQGEKVILLLSYKYKNVYEKNQDTRNSSFVLAAADAGQREREWKRDFTL